MDLASNRVLIIGIDSFTGKYLSKYLKDNGYSVYGTTKKSCDIRKKEDIKKILIDIRADYIILLAGVASPAYGDISAFYHINTIGAINLLESLVELNMQPKKILLASSATVYGNLGVEVLDESLCPKPANHYGASKYSMESIASNYFNRLNIIITRPFNYTGIGQSLEFLIPKIVYHFREKRETIELGNIDVSREFNDIYFVCEVYKRLLESSHKSEIVNICSGREIKILDILNIMSDIAKYKIEIRVNPKFIRKDEIKTLKGSPKKLYSLIGRVKQRDLKETLKDMFEA